MSLIGKQAGGFRPIGLFSSIYRLWGKGRRGYATRWEENNRRPFFAAGKFTSSTDVVWRQSVKGEVGVRDGK
eukprot:6130090-Pyramimonas_sp.AAC.1